MTPRIEAGIAISSTRGEKGDKGEKRCRAVPCRGLGSQRHEEIDGEGMGDAVDGLAPKVGKEVTHFEARPRVHLQEGAEEETVLIKARRCAPVGIVEP